MSSLIPHRTNLFPVGSGGHSQSLLNSKQMYLMAFKGQSSLKQLKYLVFLKGQHYGKRPFRERSSFLMCKARAVFSSHILSGSLSTAIFNYCSHTGWQCIRQNTRQEATLMKRFAFVCDWRKRSGGEGLMQEHVLAAPTATVLRKPERVCDQLPLLVPLFVYSETSRHRVMLPTFGARLPHSGKVLWKYPPRHAQTCVSY